MHMKKIAHLRYRFIVESMFLSVLSYRVQLSEFAFEINSQKYFKNINLIKIKKAYVQKLFFSFLRYRKSNSTCKN